MSHFIVILYTVAMFTIDSFFCSYSGAMMLPHVIQPMKVQLLFACNSVNLNGKTALLHFNEVWFTGQPKKYTFVWLSGFCVYFLSGDPFLYKKEIQHMSTITVVILVALINCDKNVYSLPFVGKITYINKELICGAMTLVCCTNPNVFNAWNDCRDDEMPLNGSGHTIKLDWRLNRYIFFSTA